MRVLVGCEESGTVRDAFIRHGHDAISNDIVPSRRPGPHLQMDVIHAIVNHGPWDIIILHPPCTALCIAGNATYGVGQPQNHERIEAIRWTSFLWLSAKQYAKVGVCMENPKGVLWGHLKIYPQYVHPYHFGHPEQKQTGLALHKLPYLRGTKNVYAEMCALPRKKRERIHFVTPGYQRQLIRSTTYEGIANAMAEQWGALIG